MVLAKELMTGLEVRESHMEGSLLASRSDLRQSSALPASEQLHQHTWPVKKTSGSQEDTELPIFLLLERGSGGGGFPCALHSLQEMHFCSCVRTYNFTKKLYTVMGLNTIFCLFEYS
jgi:hypothetical protein